MQPLGPGGEAVGRPLVAVDSVGAGPGEHVFFVRGKEASFPFHPVEVPADAGIVGIVDHWTTGERDAVVRPSRSGEGPADRSAGGGAGRSAGTERERSAGTSVPATRTRR